MCADFFADPNSEIVREIPCINMITLIIWGLCEAKLMDHVTEELKNLNISASTGLLRYTFWASSWLSFLYKIGNTLKKS